MNVIMDVIMVCNGVIMGIRDTLFAIITFVIMVYNHGVIMETPSRFSDGHGTNPRAIFLPSGSLASPALGTELGTAGQRDLRPALAISKLTQ